MSCPLPLRRFEPNLGKKGWRERPQELRALPTAMPSGWDPPFPALVGKGTGSWQGCNCPFPNLAVLCCVGFFSLGEGMGLA